MILVLSGEGPSDLGTMQLKESGWAFTPGPMAWIIDGLLARPDCLNYSIFELHANGGDCICFLSESELSALRGPKPLFLPRGYGITRNLFFFKSAYLLGVRAKAIASERNSPVIAIYFRDADGTRSTPRTEWEEKFLSMKSGFAAAELQSGVPMVPRPKSEAWMLCGLIKAGDAQTDCGWLEEEPGNDASPNSLKARLAQHLGTSATAEQQAELVSSGQISPEQIDLPSFIAFREELDRAYANAAAPLR
jgi:hypothetical protein